MKLLRIVNIIIAFIGLSGGIYHFLVEEIPVPTIAIFLFLSVMFLLNGIEEVKENKKDWMGYIFIATAMFFAIGVITQLVIG
ncbi:DUF3953 domain-containing protein [Thalassobacillus sp. C254]|uniref:DUF3953 domain-containing protein n=1 Tax=Thalassobacillus sp. C254 TaxID=1225341 RepID=UPI0006CF396D|nr:DUF3953 domain-containing protein [Thalassobacillus sp. C254]